MAKMGLTANASKLIELRKRTQEVPLLPKFIPPLLTKKITLSATENFIKPQLPQLRKVQPKTTIQLPATSPPKLPQPIKLPEQQKVAASIPLQLANTVPPRIAKEAAVRDYKGINPPQQIGITTDKTTLNLPQLKTPTTKSSITLPEITKTPQLQIKRETLVLPSPPRMKPVEIHTPFIPPETKRIQQLPQQTVSAPTTKAVTPKWDKKESTVRETREILRSNRTHILTFSSL
jgi:hypothetical protein